MRAIFNILFILFTVSIGASLVQAQTIVIRAGHLVDPAAGTIAHDQTILIDGKRITAVGSDDDISGAAEVIDLSDAYLLPGPTSSRR